MAGLVRRRETPDKRLVLGFDAGCMACSELARRVEEQVGDKLEIRSLRDPQVEEWRRRALGDDAPWAPTLIEVRGPQVRAWTGRGMAVHMGRSLGPVATWRVLQVLGELGAAQEAEESPVGALVGSMSRGQFLKGVGGAAVAMSVLFGAGEFASTALAAQKHGGHADSRIRIEDLRGDQLRAAIQGVGKDANGRVLQSSLSKEGFRSNESEARGKSITDSKDPKKKGTVMVLPYRHQDGRTANLAFGKVGDKVLICDCSIFSADGKSLKGYAVKDGKAELVRTIKDIKKERRRIEQKSRSSHPAKGKHAHHREAATPENGGGGITQEATAQADQYGGGGGGGGDGSGGGSGTSLKCRICTTVAGLALNAGCDEILQKLAGGILSSVICGVGVPECAATVTAIITAICGFGIAIPQTPDKACQFLGFC